MPRKLYSLRDLKAGTFNPPVIFDNDAVAVRSFGDIVTSDNKSMIGLHPEDFAVCYVGTFDLETGVLTAPVSGFTLLAVGSDFTKKGN